MILEVRELKKYYETTENVVKALDGIGLTVKRGEFISIVGTSGSGKSTLLNMFGGIDIPTSGEIIVDGNKINEMNDEARTLFRRRNIGFIFQSFNLIPLLNVYENIVLPVQLDGKKPDKEYVHEILKILKLEEKINFLPSALSGGQQQRVAIARALVIKPAIILADEPTGNLDSNTTKDVLELLNVAARKFNQTVVMITHNNNIAKLSDRIISIEDGKIVNCNCL